MRASMPQTSHGLGQCPRTCSVPGAPSIQQSRSDRVGVEHTERSVVFSSIAGGRVASLVLVEGVILCGNGMHALPFVRERCGEVHLPN
jgi:hypothetical protein